MKRYKCWTTNPVTGEWQRDRTTERNWNGGGGMRDAVQRLREARNPPVPRNRREMTQAGGEARTIPGWLYV